MQTYNSFVDKIDGFFASPHLQIARFDEGFFEDMSVWMTQESSWPVMYLVPQEIDHLTNSVSQYTIRVYFLDLLSKDESNVRDILSDQQQTSRDFTNWLRENAENGLNLLREPRSTPVKSIGMDFTCGWYTDYAIEVNTEMTDCAIPFSGIFPPAPPSCPDAEWTLENALQVVLSSGTIESGSSTVITAPSATYELQDTDGNTLDGGSIPSSGADVIVAPNAAWTLQDTTGITLDSGSIVSNGSDIIVAPNASVGINGNTGLFTVPSGSPINIMVEQDGLPIGTFDPITNSWVIPPCPPSGVSLAVAVSDMSPNIGDTITITATPSSGFVPTEYTFLVFDGTAQILAVQSGNTFNWPVDVPAGNWTIYVLATDGVDNAFATVDIVVTIPYYLNLWPDNARSSVSMQLLSSTYAGDMLRARVASSEQNIGFDGDGRDNAALSAFAGSSSAFMPRWDDQSGIAGGNFTQSTAGNQPRVALNGVSEQVDGLDAMRANGSSDFMLCAEMDAALRINNQPFTHHIVIQFAPSAGNYNHRIWRMQDSASSTSTHQLSINPITGISFHSKQYTAVSSQTNLFTYTDPYNIHLLTVDYDGTNSRVYVDGVLVGTEPMSGTFAATLQTLNLFRRGAPNNTEYFNGHVFESIFHDASQFAAGHINDQMNNIIARHGI